jgi:hypothetical protein
MMGSNAQLDRVVISGQRQYQYQRRHWRRQPAGVNTFIKAA